MITLDYVPDRKSALIVADPDSPTLAWTRVTSLCEENGQDVINRSSMAIEIPWWSLLSFRREVGYVRRMLREEYGIEWKITERALNMLSKARARESSFQDAQSSKPIHEEQIVEHLRAAGFVRVLKPYQLRNVARLASLPAGATFSVPGAGKTSEALALYMLRRQPDSALVVVAPKNAFAVWEEQIEQCVPGLGLNVVRLQGGVEAIRGVLEKEPEISIVSYQQLPRALAPVADYIVSKDTSVFLDESHRMKAGLDGVAGSSLLRISPLPTYKLLLSGTPMPNSISDLVPQFAFLYPEVRVSESNVVRSLNGIYVRTTKGELELPPLTRVKLGVELTPPQRRLYQALTSNAQRLLLGLHAKDRIRFRAFANCVMHLLQAASDPSLLANTELSDHPLLAEAMIDPSPKLMEACRLARELARRGQKCVIWSFFVQTVEHLASTLSDVGAEYIHGGVDTSPDEALTDTREAKLRRFHDDDRCMVLVANPASCAESISLHQVCHNAIYVDRTYNAAQYLQSEDRIHRLGLKPDQQTNIAILHTPGTIDDSVERRLAAKVSAMRDVLNDQDLDVVPLNLDDLDSIGLDQSDLADLRSLLLGEN